MRQTDMREKDELDARIECALEAAPPFIVPEDFAARVATQAKGMRRALPSDAGTRAPGVGRTSMWVLAVLLLIAILVLAPGVPPLPGAVHGTRFWVAFALELEFALLAFGLSWRGLAA